MNFSDKFKVNGKLCAFSPDGCFLASCLQNRLRVQNVVSLQTAHIFACIDTVQSVKWSPDSKYILTATFTKAIVQVWSLEDVKWTCKIDEGSAGLIATEWSTDSRHILTTAEFHLRITVWSLINKSISYIRYPKSVDHGITFTNDGVYMALGERRDCKDFISIFSCNSWQLVKHFQCDTKDMAGLAWSPRDRILCVWDSLLEYKVLLYSMDGHCLSSYSAYHGSLGVKCVSWSPSGQLLAIGSYDQKVRILNHLTWKSIVEHFHTTQITDTDVIVYQEATPKPTRLASHFSTALSNKCEIVEKRPVVIQAAKPDLNKPNPKVGIGKALFSNNGQYLATKNDSVANAVWIWDVEQIRLAAILIQSQPVTSFAWNPVRPHLAVCTGSSKVFIWTSEGSTIVPFPHQCILEGNFLRWHPDGNSLLILGKDEFCICFCEDKNGRM